MSQEWKCRECRTPLAGAAHVRLPQGIPGPTGLCLDCAEKQTEVHHSQVLRIWIPKYVQAIKTDSPVTALRREVQELRALLDQLTQPDTKER